MVANASSSFRVYYHCSDFTYGRMISLAFAIVHVLFLVPLSLLVLHLGVRRWRHSSAAASPSDVFACHSAIMELIYALGAALSLCGASLGLLWMEKLGLYTSSNLFPGQISFHVLTCAEHYLAVGRPVLYLRLRRSGGVRVRNASVGCVWLLYCGWFGLTALYYPNVADVPFFCLLVCSFVAVSFCSLSVLRALTRERVGRAKRRALHTVTAVAAAQGLFVLGSLVSLALDQSGLLSYGDGCLALTCGYVLSLPSDLVLPLLLLHRAEKPACCRSGGGWSPSRRDIRGGCSSWSCCLLDLM